MAQPIGELAANLRYDPPFRNETALQGAGAAAATVGGAGGGGLLSGVASAAGGVMAKHPLLSYAAIQAAKRIPGIGPYLEKVPGIEWLPLLAGGEAPSKVSRLGKIGAEAAEAAPAAAEGEAASAGAKAAETAETTQAASRDGARRNPGNNSDGSGS